MSHTCTCARVCALACACVCKHIEITPFLGFSLSHYVHIAYICPHSSNFSSCETIFLFLCAQMMWQRVEHPIAAFNHDRRLSFKRRGTWRTLVP